MKRGCSSRSVSLGGPWHPGGGGPGTGSGWSDAERSLPAPAAAAPSTCLQSTHLTFRHPNVNGPWCVGVPGGMWMGGGGARPAGSWGGTGGMGGFVGGGRPRLDGGGTSALARFTAGPSSLSESGQAMNRAGGVRTAYDWWPVRGRRSRRVAGEGRLGVRGRRRIAWRAPRPG